MRTLSRCLISILMAAFGLVLVAPLTLGAGPAIPTSLVLNVDSRVTLGSPARIEATLRDQSGKPVGEAVVRLYTSATFFSTESGPIEIGQATTGPDGVAVFEYVPSRNVTMEVRAEYQGDGQYGPSQAMASFVVEELPANPNTGRDQGPLPK